MKNTMSFFGNESIIIIFMGLGLVTGVLTNQDSITTATIGALAGYLGNEAKHSLKEEGTTEGGGNTPTKYVGTETDVIKAAVKSAMKTMAAETATISEAVPAVSEETTEATISN